MSLFPPFGVTGTANGSPGAFALLRTSAAANPINTDTVEFAGQHNSIFVTSGGYTDPTVDFTEVAPVTAPINSGGIYNLNAPGNIFQGAFSIINTGTRPAVALYAHAEGALGYGANIAYLAKNPGDIGQAMEVDFGLRGTTGGSGTANGINVHFQGSYNSAGGYLSALSNTGAGAPRYFFQIALENPNNYQPLQSGGVIFETSGAIQTAYGIDWHSAAFSAAAVYIPHNRGSAGGAPALKIEGRGGFANTSAMIELSALAASGSTAAHGIRFVTGGGGPVAASGNLIHVDGGTFARFADLSAATFAASGAIAMGDNNISFGTTTGGKIGTSTTQKIGFFNATPIVQPTVAAAATDLATVITLANSLRTNQRNLGLAV